MIFKFLFELRLSHNTHTVEGFSCYSNTVEGFSHYTNTAEACELQQLIIIVLKLISTFFSEFPFTEIKQYVHLY